MDSTCSAFFDMDKYCNDKSEFSLNLYYNIISLYNQSTGSTMVTDSEISNMVLVDSNGDETIVDNANYSNYMSPSLSGSVCSNVLNSITWNIYYENETITKVRFDVKIYD